MKHACPADFAYAKPAEFPRDVVRSIQPQIDPADGQICALDQWLDLKHAGGGLDSPSYTVSPAVGNAALRNPVTTEADAEQAPKAKRRKRPAGQGTRRGPGRPPKRGRPRQPKADGRRATEARPLSAAQRRDVFDAVDFAADLDRGMDTTIDIHPAFLDAYPAGELRDWFRTGPWRAMGEFFTRRRDDAGRPLGWYAFATRENYEGERREHLHIVCRCPACHRDALQKMLQRRFPGDPRAIRVGELKAEGIGYRLKQSAGNAMGPPRPGRPTPEKHSRHDGALVAPVRGKRTMVSRSIDLAARTHAGWQADRDAWRAARRDHFRARRREEEDHGGTLSLGRFA